MLDNHPRTQLCFIIQQYGQVIINEPKRCKGLLSDLAPQNRLEINLLIAALEQNIAQELLHPSALIPVTMQLDLLAKRLHDAVGTREDFAYWAVESWALALGVSRHPLPKKVQSIANVSPPKPIKATPSSTSSISFSGWHPLPAPATPPVQKQSTPSSSQKKSTPPVQKQTSTNWGIWIFGIIVVSISAIMRLGSKPQSTPTTNTPPATVTSVPVQSVPQATLQRADDLYKQNRYAEALPLYQSLAEQGVAIAQHNLGFMYAKGQGVAKDEAQSVVWYRKAAEQGETQAQAKLGAMYELGKSVAKDDTQAVYWFRKAAEQGETQAQAKLGAMYKLGKGVAKDDTQAVYWYRKAAEQGSVYAQYILGLMYKLGKSVVKDDTQAVYWFRKAAEQGDVDAIAALKKLGQ